MTDLSIHQTLSGPLPFSDARSAKSWLQLLPLINTPIAHAELSDAIALLATSGIAPYETLKILELLREPLHVVQGALAERFLGRALPLGPDEAQARDATVALWSRLADLYGAGLDAALAGDAETAPHAALLAQRRMRYLALAARESLLSYRPIPAELWQQLFDSYQLIEANGLAEKSAKDSLLKVAGVATPQHAFVHLLLLAASAPFHFTGRQIRWLDEHLPSLAQRTPLEREAAALPGRGSLQIDFAQPGAPRRTEPRLTGDTVRELDTLQLAQALSRRIKLLRQGESPEKLGLGSQFAAAQVETLLVELYRTWCEQASERALPRHDSQRQLEAVFGLPRQHALLGHERFALPDDGPAPLGSQDLVRLQLFGQSTVAGATGPETVTPQPGETWQVRNESAQGLRLSRSNDAGGRIALQQLLSVQLEGNHYLGVVRWLQEHDGSVEVGVRLMPGLPSAAAIRPVELAYSDRRGWIECLSLPAVAALRAPQSLILPVGWYRRGRLIEWWDGSTLRKMRVEALLERGVDFERMHVVPAGQQRR
ncbi:hypothetical protein [Jeongeupia chitinilytica]|uniref:Molecular chaperone n=1 Tax=Jeongeupia chitinilytica TaxID=1041641 RepID=A0ABQ3GYF5_9NEIS|nr:hypothetical protein [Jeongeupia chitinilytica]GHD61331.1 hypothetical protein GCM10007350_15520 [Jeongeupia chitinilytica]